jgi:uncharacterized protein (TIGR01777 family)
MKILITGATGLIGRSLCQILAGDGHELMGLSRKPGKSLDPIIMRFSQWEPEEGPPGPEVWEGVQAVVHLAGEPVDARRWSADQKRKIRDSRVIGTRNLVAGLAKCSDPPKILIAGSAVGYYGSRGDEILTETSSPGEGFLSDVCQEWEGEALAAQQTGARVVLIRTGIVLSAEGGALKRMLTPFNFGLGGELGAGNQWFPWIHIADIVGLFRHAIKSSQLVGPVNGAAPGVVQNREFTKTLAAALGRPVFFSIPEFALDLLVGEMSRAIMASQRVVPEVAQRTGYAFRYPDLQAALEDLLIER